MTIEDNDNEKPFGVDVIKLDKYEYVENILVKLLELPQHHPHSRAPLPPPGSGNFIQIARINEELQIIRSDEERDVLFANHEHYEYAEKIIGNLKTTLNLGTVDALIGMHETSDYHNRNVNCGFCNEFGIASVSGGDMVVWVGNCCRNQLLTTVGMADNLSRCAKCGIHNKQGRGFGHGFGICNNCISSHPSETIIQSEEIDRHLKIIRSEKYGSDQLRANLNETAAIYIKAGLAEPFAWAIANGIDAKEIMDLWESDWWRQYSIEDPLIVSLLKGRLTQVQGKRLNNARSEHESLVLACIKEPQMIEWAMKILDTEFNKYPEAIEDLLNGADPVIIARIRKINVDLSILPPMLNKV